ncbi:GNAT family N-acetyltransferase [Pedobacter sp.]|uniref:GNAT family N-acetyltransferase n=1 Tax=Pedobacter sp. TaxID=1411316 RepID=UPI003BA9E438
MESIVIERAKPGDVKKLQEIGRFTFSESFAHLNSEEDMQNYLEQSFAEEKLNIELTNKDSQIYFALSDERIVGYLKINVRSAQTENIDINAFEIERIYVMKEFHGKKVGQMFYQKAIDIAQNMNAAFVWLGVWVHNDRAQSFYKKNGFVVFDKHIFKLGNDIQTDLMMKKMLTGNENTAKI